MCSIQKEVLCAACLLLRQKKNCKSICSVRGFTTIRFLVHIFIKMFSTFATISQDISVVFNVGVQVLYNNDKAQSVTIYS